MTLKNDVRPFKALYYNPDKVNKINDCLSQPYDVISPKQQDAYYDKHPNNVIRLILNKILKDDNTDNNRYTRAKALLSEWKEQEILKLDKKPAYWIYEMEFSLPGKRNIALQGFISAVRLQNYDDKAILPHEKVMAGPIEDRVKLTQTTKTQFESIWGYYKDSTNTINDILKKNTKKEPLINFIEKPNNVKHKLWRLNSQKDCKTIHEKMKELKIYIADGHHRYKTMLSVRDDLREKNPNAPSDSPWEFINMYLVNSVDSGLTVLPYHRMLHDAILPSTEKLMQLLAMYFEIKEYNYTETDVETVKKTWVKELKNTEDGKKHIFGLVIKGKEIFYQLTLKNVEAYLNLIPKEMTEEWKMLDVNVLNILVLNNILGFTEKQLKLKTNFEYTHDSLEAIKQVRSGDMQMAFLLNPTPLNSVTTLSNKGEIIPQKSTFFYPKPISGLAFYSMEPEIQNLDIAD